MKKNSCIVSILFFALGLVSCRESLEPNQYAKRMTQVEKGPIHSLNVKDIAFELQYRFPKYEALISMTGERLNEDTIQSREVLFGTDHKFKLRIYPSDKKGNILKHNLQQQEQYFERIQYFSSEVKNDFAIVTKADTVYASHCALERSYGMAPYIDLIISFDKKEGDQLKELIFLDRALTQEKVVFDISRITNERNYPKLKI